MSEALLGREETTSPLREDTTTSSIPLLQGKSVNRHSIIEHDYTSASESSAASGDQRGPRYRYRELKRLTPETDTSLINTSFINSSFVTSLVINPDTTPWLPAWDVFIVTVLFMTAYYEPYAVAVLYHDPLWAVWLNHFLDFSFTLDMGLQFITAYPNVVESSSGSLWEKSICKISRRYCAVPFSGAPGAGYFWIDLLAVLPGWIDTARLLAGQQSLLGESSSQEFEDSTLGKYLVLVRLFRLIRIVKVMRINKILIKIHERRGFPLYMVELAKFVGITTLTCHWMACLWIIMDGRVRNGKISYHTNKESWLSALIAAKGDSCPGGASTNAECVFSIALYWSMMTLTTVGYGDISPQNPAEYSVCSMCMLITAYIWAYIVAKIVTIIEALDPAQADFQKQADKLQMLMDQRGLPQDLQRRLRKFLHEAKGSSQQESQQKLLLKSVSHHLQREVAKCSGVCEDFVRAVYWAQDLQQDALLDLVRALHPASFGPNETILAPQTLILFRRGVAILNGKVRRRGDVVGQDDILLETAAIIETATPRTLSHVDTMFLYRSSLIKVCSTFPHADRRIRRAQIRTAAFRAFILAAKQIKEEEQARRSHGRASRSSIFMSHDHVDRDLQHTLGAATSFVTPGADRLHVRTEQTGDAELGGHRLGHASLVGDVNRLLQDLVHRHKLLDSKVNSLIQANDDQLKGHSNARSGRRGPRGERGSIMSPVQAGFGMVTMASQAAGATLSRRKKARIRGGQKHAHDGEERHRGGDAGPGDAMPRARSSTVLGSKIVSTVARIRGHARQRSAENLADEDGRSVDAEKSQHSAMSMMTRGGTVESIAETEVTSEAGDESVCDDDPEDFETEVTTDTFLEQARSLEDPEGQSAR